MYTKEQIEKAWKLAESKGIRYFSAVGSNAKTIKSDKKTKYLTRIMYLAPSTQSGYNLCPMASKGCAEACLYTAGHGAIPSVKDARIKRARFWIEHKDAFKACIFDEINKHIENCKKKKRKPAVRLNGTSDIIWEKQFAELFTYFNGVQFYDYTKIWPRLLPNYRLPKNYHLTLSRSETNQKFIEQIIKTNNKVNVAAVFDNLPKTWMGRKVIDGDLYDARFLDPKGIVVGLVQKGDGKKDASGFVIRSDTKIFLPTIKGKKIFK